MAELIDKKNLFNNLFVRNGKVCPNSDIDNFPTTIDVKEVKKAILEQPTTTEAEIRNKAINEFFDELQKYEKDDWLKLKMLSIYHIAEQLKEELS